jgi:hypothetical protein
MSADTVLHARLHSFRAPDEPGLCDRFQRAHREAIGRHMSLKGIGSLNDEWPHHALTQVVVVEADDGELLAGVRLQRDDGVFPLPTARAYPDARLLEWIEASRADGVAEVCGAWAAPRLARCGVFPLTICAAFATLPRLGLRRVMASCGTHTIAMTLGIGLVIETSFGHHGTFYYPTPDNLSFFCVMDDTESLHDASPPLRATALDLRARPRQLRTVASEIATIAVEVDIEVSAGGPAPRAALPSTRPCVTSSSPV